jgi:hypothetical protein
MDAHGWVTLSNLDIGILVMMSGYSAGYGQEA